MTGRAGIKEADSVVGLVIPGTPKEGVTHVLTPQANLIPGDPQARNVLPSRRRRRGELAPCRAD
jgi:hypothetical protein